ncbi:hypothetical protein [Pontibacter toksunensis]|uniref:hypothetical protein n=1 Tax=Pontibacter toksunensis TaxID=1332631 RepID=UPI00366F0A31
MTNDKLQSASSVAPLSPACVARKEPPDAGATATAPGGQEKKENEKHAPYVAAQVEAAEDRRHRGDEHHPLDCLRHRPRPNRNACFYPVAVCACAPEKRLIMIVKYSGDLLIAPYTLLLVRRVAGKIKKR